MKCNCMISNRERKKIYKKAFKDSLKVSNRENESMKLSQEAYIGQLEDMLTKLRAKIVSLKLGEK